jgi:hypothetical protein
MRGAIVLVGMLATVAAVAACRWQPAPRAYELSDEQERHEQELNRVLSRLDQPVQGVRAVQLRPDAAVRAHFVGRVATLEAAVDRSPDDLDALNQLLVAYWRGVVPPTEDARKPAPGASDVQADPLLMVRRRERILWLITHDPESSLAGSVQARLFPKRFAAFFPADPEGYARARQEWLTITDRPDVTSEILGHAASFFDPFDKLLAEKLLLRARAISPGTEWSVRLGTFYADAITSRQESAVAGPAWVFGSFTGVARVDPSNLAFAEVAKMKLGDTKDPDLLTGAGVAFASLPRYAGVSFDAAVYARECFERAIELAPDSVRAHSELLWLKGLGGGRNSLWQVPPDQEYAHVASLPEAERFGRLADLAHDAVRDLDQMDRYHDPNLKARADLDRRNAEQGAREALRLAARHRDHLEYGTAVYLANMTLGSLALRDGDRTAAIQYLNEASHAPSSERLAYGQGLVLDWPGSPLPRKLLAAGERDAVAAFLERMARTNLAARVELRDKAAAIRRGESPRL